MEKSRRRRFVLCVKNAGYPVSLEVRKVYEEKPDPAAARLGMVRVVDESNQDYLYPADFFTAIDVPKNAARVFAFPPRPTKAGDVQRPPQVFRSHAVGRR